MKAVWRIWSDRYAALSKREQVMVAVAMVAAAGFLLVTFWVDPATRRGTDLRNGLATRQTELTALEGQIAGLKSQLEDPDAVGRRQLAELQARLGAVDAQIGKLDDQLVPPQRMGLVLDKTLDLRVNLLRTDRDTLRPSRDGGR